VVSRILIVWLIAWTAAAAPTAAEPTPEGPSSAAKPKPDETVPAATREGPDERLSAEDEELIKNLDLVESLDLLDTVETFSGVSTPDTPEEEF
jgi:hypothetical protein